MSPLQFDTHTLKKNQEKTFSAKHQLFSEPEWPDSAPRTVSIARASLP